MIAAPTVSITNNGAGAFFRSGYDFEGDRETEWVLEKCDIRMEMNQLTISSIVIICRERVFLVQFGKI
jgi:hypothetical protein